MIDFIIIAVFFLFVALGHVAIAPLPLAVLFGCLAVGRLLKGERP